MTKMNATKRRILIEHRSEFPHPISVHKGAPLTVGERYAGPEKWENWFFCEVPGQEGGWVPGQIIEMIGLGCGRVTEDYTARELNVQCGEEVLGSKELNGWLWCEKMDGSASGWVPLANLQPQRCNGEGESSCSSGGVPA
jgi:hypothetical protein